MASALCVGPLSKADVLSSRHRGRWATAAGATSKLPVGKQQTGVWLASGRQSKGAGVEGAFAELNAMVRTRRSRLAAGRPGRAEGEPRH